jgi:hypothetical protein
MNGAHLLTYKYDILSTYQKRKYSMSQYFLGDVEYSLEEWANISYIGNWKKGEDCCAVKFISNKFPHLYWEIKKLQTKKGVSFENFRDFCDEHSIMYIFKDINNDDLYDGDKICNNIDLFKDLDNFNIQQALCAIVYEGHIYPYSGGKLKRIAKKPRSIKLVKDATNDLIKLYKNNICPRNVIVSTKLKDNKYIIGVDSYIYKGVKYFENSEYEMCVKILKKFNIEKCIPTNISMSSLIDFILSIRKGNHNVSSFLPDKDLYKAKAITWETDDDVDPYIENIKGIDKNKCYHYALTELPYLIIHDWRKHRVTDISKSQNHQINDSYLYLVKARYFSVPIPKSGLYPGYHLKKYNWIEFDILEELETDTCVNFYREILLELYNILNMNDFKKMGVRIIGKMERDIGEISKFLFKCIISKDIDYKEGPIREVNDYKLCFNKKDLINNIRDQIPINIQIKCHAYSLLTDKIKELKLNDNDIVQINTDALYYYGDYPSYLKNKDINVLKKDFKGWKISEDFKSREAFKINFLEDNNIIPTLELTNNNDKKRVLYMKYAGNGKTFEIVNNLVTKCIRKNKSYIVLTPTHSTLNDIKNTKIIIDSVNYDINCDILQKYCFDGSIPDTDIVIIDEIGFCGADCHDFLFKLNRANKSYYCFGDFNQMPPIGETRTFNQPHYLKYMFNKIDTEFINYRNNFTKEYYDQLITGKLDPYSEVFKLSSPLEYAETCICFRNETRDIMNDKILEFKGLKKYSVGTKVICTTNRLLDTSDQFPIYHHKEFTIFKIKKIEKDNAKKPIKKFILIDSNGNKSVIENKRFYANFRHSYCINIYEAQGKTFQSYHWAEEDKNWLLKKRYATDTMRNKLAYTIISRISHPYAAIKGKMIQGFLELEKMENNKMKNKIDKKYSEYVERITKDDSIKKGPIYDFIKDMPIDKRKELYIKPPKKSKTIEKINPNPKYDFIK